MAKITPASILKNISRKIPENIHCEKAFWEDKMSGMIFLDRDWLWDAQLLPIRLKSGLKIEFTRISHLFWANLSGFYIDSETIHFCLFRENFLNRDSEDVDIYVAGDFNNWGNAIGQEAWKMSWVTHSKTLRYLNLRLNQDSLSNLQKAKNGGMNLNQNENFSLNQNQLSFKFVTRNNTWLDVPQNAPNAVYDSHGIRNYGLDFHKTGLHIFRFKTKGSARIWNESLLLNANLGNKENKCFDTTCSTPTLENTTSHETIVPIDCRKTLFKLDSPHRLGAFIEGSKTTFRLFAPRASQVYVHLYKKPPNDACSIDSSPSNASNDKNRLQVSKTDRDTEKSSNSNSIRFLQLQLIDETTWEASCNENLTGWYYTFQVDGESQDTQSHFDKNFKILDPYACAVFGQEGLGLILAPERLKPFEYASAKNAPQNPFTAPPLKDLIILEGHIRDFIANAPIDLTPEERMGFAGLTKWIRTQGSYLKTLGINAVELQPIQEFDNKTREAYHWGYMPVNYFSPASAYALDPERGSQVEEFKELVRAFHDTGIAVILDVVYNHVGEPAHVLFIDKAYYLVTNDDGSLSNWSGCGNDFRANTPIGKRLIIDSLKHWICVYGVDGFRFDLSELLGLEVLKDIECALKEVKPSIILIAEPWSFRGHIGHALKDTGYTSWNDGYRDFLAHYVCGNGNQNGIRYFLSGSRDYLSVQPIQTLNYTESHDDYCWLDKITENRDHNGFYPTNNDRRRTHLMFAILMSSLGIPMIGAGQDMLRSKQGICNTYQRGDLNALDYHRLLEYSGTHEYFKSWIAFRLSQEGRLWRLTERSSDTYIAFYWGKNNSAMVALFNADKSLGEKQLLFAVNPHLYAATIDVVGISKTHFRQIADHERFKAQGLESDFFYWERETITMPPLSCGLWKNHF